MTTDGFRAERGGKAKAIGEACLAIEARVFELWHLFRGGGLSRRQLDNRMARQILELLDVLRQGERSRDRKTARFCRRVLEVYPALWTFVAFQAIEPTNHHAERVQRLARRGGLAVLYRKNCFGCHSDSGCRFVERLPTVVQTLRLQQRSVLHYFRQAFAAHRTGQPKPKLVPAP
jgi:transposase